MKAVLIEIRREFWEHRALWLAPLAIGLVLLLGAAAFGHVRFDMRDGQWLQEGNSLPRLYQFVLLGWALPFYLAAAILASAYLLDCLYAERRDRGILFWRSMPVSDARAVLVKFAVGLLIVPLGSYALAALTSVLASAILMLRSYGLDALLFNRAALVAGPGVIPWDSTAWLAMQAGMLYGLIAALLWYAPFAAYLVLISGWARRSPYAWALIPPVLLVILEHLEFGTNYVGGIVNGGFTELMHLAYGFGDADRAAASGAQPLELTPLHLLSSPRLWCGLLAAALMIALAIRLRRYRDDG
jgi:ABC-2 type transport system permease protein